MCGEERSLPVRRLEGDGDAGLVTLDDLEVVTESQAPELVRDPEPGLVVTHRPEQPMRHAEGGERERHVAGCARRSYGDAVDDVVTARQRHGPDRAGEDVHLHVADDVHGAGHGLSSLVSACW